MSLEYRVGDVFDELAKIPDGSIDLIVTSPPFLALRSYLPADHPDKGKEIGSEATPADFLDTLLALSAEWGRVLAPHGSLCVELGDTYSGSGGGGGDYLPGGLREDQPGFGGPLERRNMCGQPPRQDGEGSKPRQPNRPRPTPTHARPRSVARDACRGADIPSDRSRPGLQRSDDLAQRQHVTLDHRNADLARERVGMFLEIVA